LWYHTVRFLLWMIVFSVSQHGSWAWWWKGEARGRCQRKQEAGDKLKRLDTRGEFEIFMILFF
jgi:hypothetical protein